MKTIEICAMCGYVPKHCLKHQLNKLKNETFIVEIGVQTMEQIMACFPVGYRKEAIAAGIARELAA